jgi:hypothetical protein
MARAAANPSNTRSSDAAVEGIIATLEVSPVLQLEIERYDARGVKTMRAEKMCLYECTRRAPEKDAR